MMMLSPGAVQAKTDPAEVLDRVAKILADQDSYAAIEYVLGLGEPPVVAIGRAGILYSLVRARDLAGKSPDRAASWRGHAKMIAYNVGSFTWPGWGRDGYELTDEHARAGREAADLNLRLAIELKRPPQKLSAAHWLVGAHHLSAADPAAAIRSFQEAQAQSKKAGDEEGALMGAGDEALARFLGGEKEAKTALDGAMAALMKRGTDDARFYAEQLGKVLTSLKAWSARK